MSISIFVENAQAMTLFATKKGSGLEDSERFRGAESVHRCWARIVLFKEEKGRNTSADALPLTGVQLMLLDFF